MKVTFFGMGYVGLVQAPKIIVDKSTVPLVTAEKGVAYYSIGGGLSAQ